MQSTRQQGTAAELAVRSILHARGLRYRVNRAVLPGVRREADLVFQGARVAVFVDGCFWHGCPDHASWPKANAEWWRDKILANKRRDADTDRRFAEAGWQVIRVWEHESPMEAADRIEEAFETGSDARSRTGIRR
jgi:DNA mismatch endonuclease (patch repair protein)